MDKDTASWPVWDGKEKLDGRRVRLNYPNGDAYAVGTAAPLPTHRASHYRLDGTDIWFGSVSNRVRVAPEGTR